MDFNTNNEPINNSVVSNSADSAVTSSEIVSSASVSDSASETSVAPSSEASNSAESGAVTKVDLPTNQKPLSERTKVEDHGSRIRMATITEKNGTVITATIQAPKLSDTPDIDDARFDLVVKDGITITKPNTKDFYTKLFGLISDLRVTDTDGKTTVQKANWDFFNKHTFEAYRFFVNELATFYTDYTEAVD